MRPLRSVLLMTASRIRRKLLFACTVFVVATVVAVAAIALPIYVADDAADKATACEHEYTTVQAGLDAYMAINDVSTLPANARTSNITPPFHLYFTIITETISRYFTTYPTTPIVDLP